MSCEQEVKVKPTLKFCDPVGLSGWKKGWWIEGMGIILYEKTPEIAYWRWRFMVSQKKLEEATKNRNLKSVSTLSAHTQEVDPEEDAKWLG